MSCSVANHLRGILASGVLVIGLLAGAMVPHSAHAQDAASSPAIAKSGNPAVAPDAAAEPDPGIVIRQRVLGNPDAKIKIREYSSMTCPHCAAFHTTILPKIKETYIDTGKASLEIIDFPFDGLALRAAMLARCVPDDRYFGFIDVLYENQERWARNKDPLQSLETYGGLAGMPPAAIQGCLQNETLMNAILTRQLEAQEKLQVRSTPTFIINNGQEKIVGAESFEKFQQVFDSILNGG